MDTFRSYFGRRRRSIKKISLGVCAMDKKATSKPMRAILTRLPEDYFDVTVFGDDCLLNKPVEEWPVVECLISFFSGHFPIEKGLAYVELRKPFMINDLDMEILGDRRRVYELLVKNGIEVPRHVFLERDDPEKERTNVLEEYDEYIVVNGVQINKPLVEKPVDAEDHAIYIYYPMSAGGGSKRLFRKVKDRSSEFYPHHNDLRREGSYIYEEFLVTQGTDVKVYTVGPDYGHAEARKSPVVDGRVNRDLNGMEVRYPVILTHLEKEIARTIVMAFKQYVCGFDILRVAGKSYVCDVNGWSFVKNSRKYYDDCSQVLTEYMLSTLRPSSKERPKPPLPRTGGKSMEKRGSGSTSSSSSGNGGGTVLGSSPFTSNLMQIAGGGGVGSASPIPKDALSSSQHSESGAMFAADTSAGNDEELRSVIAVIRHGDRTPKQKMKVKITEQRYLDYFHEFAASADKDLKVKSKPALLRFLQLTREILKEKDRGDADGLGLGLGLDGDEDLLRKLRQIRDVLERRESSGINRKLQMKPLKWAHTEDPPPTSSALSGSTPVSTPAPPSAGEAVVLADAPPSPPRDVNKKRATQLLVILKWGGDLTPVGQRQAEKVGTNFRNAMYPAPTGGGILRLHATYRHDLKIKASDEGRVMKTAAAFTKGLLELEGELTPILASLVTVEEKSRQMLDKGGNYMVKNEMDRCKSVMQDKLQKDHELGESTMAELVPASQISVRQGLQRLGNPRTTLARMHELIDGMCKELDALALREIAGEPVPELYLGETFDLMEVRWQKLNKDFLDRKTNLYDLTKVPDVYDMIRFDVLHNHALGLQDMEELYELSMAFADTVVPQEYGIDEVEKRIIGSMMCSALLEKITHDLQAGVASGDERGFMLDHSHAEDLEINTPERLVRTRLYFTSESHLHTLLNVLRFPKNESDGKAISEDGKLIVATCPELSYLTQIVFRLYESKTKPGTFRCCISFSPGATSDPRVDKEAVIEDYKTLNDNIPVEELIACLRKGSAAVEDEGQDYFRDHDMENDTMEGDSAESTGRPRKISDPLKLKRTTSITVITGNDTTGSLWDFGDAISVRPNGAEISTRSSTS